MAHDPAVHRDLDGIRVAESAYAAAEGADALVVLTEWDEFRWLDFAKIAEVMTSAKIYDSRNVLDAAAARKAGIEIKSLGRA